MGDEENSSFSCCFCPACCILSQRTSGELESTEGLLVVPFRFCPCSLGRRGPERWQVSVPWGNCPDQRVFTALGTRKGSVMSGVTGG